MAVFHFGESAVQQRAGVPQAHIDKVTDFIRSSMPDQHRTFFESLPVLFMGLLDESGRPWATPVFGQPGFMQTPDEHTLTLSKTPVMAQELGLEFSEGAKVGAVGIELATRRRNRFNGTVQTAGNSNGLTRINIDQSYGNCPQYIQTREMEPSADTRDGFNAKKLETLTDEARELIERADTFFIASRASDLSDDPGAGVDASHRGGRPGFLGISDTGELSFPDFSGNMFFNTLGNIQDDGRAGLFIPDFNTGAAVFITGQASIDWDKKRIASFAGAERIIDIKPDEIWFAKTAMPAKAPVIESWPVLQTTGTWQDARLAGLKTEGYRDFRITNKVAESDVITSFYLTPADGGPLEPYTAGQFLPIRITAGGGPLMRNYTISQGPGNQQVRLSIKREEHGKVSRLLHDEFTTGDNIEVREPAGDFVLDDSQQAIVMLSAGVGITPMIAMLDGHIADVKQGKQPRDIWFFHAAVNGRTRAFGDYLEKLNQQHQWLRVHTVFSNPDESDLQGAATQVGGGRLSMDTLSSLLPFGAYQFFLCGPEGFMRSFYTGLREVGIEESHIHYEVFGTGSLHDYTTEDTETEIALPEKTVIEFSGSNKTAVWTPDSGTLLELAEATGVSASYNCRSGKCGACAAQLIEGEVQYANKPAMEPADGQVLVCCAQPVNAGKIVLGL